MKIPFLFPFLPGELHRKARKDAKQGIPLDLLSDFVFKTLFTLDDEDSREACRLLLSACIRRPVASLSVRNNEILPEYLTGKTVRLDVHLTFNDGEKADLEMQMKRSGDNIKVRATLYAAKLLAGQARRGQDYTKIKRVYQIFFLNFILFPGSDKIPRRYAMREEDEHDELSGVATTIFYELPKLEKLVQVYLDGKLGLEVLSGELKWGIYFRYRNNVKMAGLIEELCREEKGIMHAERALRKISRTEEQWARNLFREKASMDYVSGMEAARLEGQKAADAKYQPIIEAKDHALEAQARENEELRRKLREAGIDS
jgi:predicted transposase/invertase (TIGR01784 family)